MHIPVKWLKDWIDFDKSLDDVGEEFTSLGIELEGIAGRLEPIEHVVVAQVQQAERHPNADKLQVAEVFDGEQSYQVVCGAANCRKGINCAFAKIGAKLPGDFEIKKAKLRGVESFGMLAARQELGLESEDEGIVELPEDAKLGSDPSQYLNRPVFELGLTPNLAHCFSIRGCARELAALWDQPLKKKDEVLPELNQGTSYRAKISEKAACPRYNSLLVEGVKVGPSPQWLQEYLEAAGMRPINNVVDITNYVMLDLGHPLHAFDRAKLEGDLEVRFAKEAEPLTTLDGAERFLNPSILVIADSKKAVALAGVMGGANSEVDEKSVDLVLEAAYFDPVVVRKGAKQLKLSSESSKRFERGCDPCQLKHSLQVAAKLLEELAGGKAQALFDEKDEAFLRQWQARQVGLRLGFLNKVLGLELGEEEAAAYLKRLGFKVESKKGELLCTVPSFRHDIAIEIDLVEEVARLIGFSKLPKPEAKWTQLNSKNDALFDFEKPLRSFMLQLGLQEVMSSTLISPKWAEFDQKDESRRISTVNATSLEWSILRNTMLPSALALLKHNWDQQNKDLAAFEIGKVFFSDPHKLSPANCKDKESPYQEHTALALTLMGQRDPQFWNGEDSNYDFYDMKGQVEDILAHFNIEAQFVASEMDCFHPGRQAKIMVGEICLGHFGELHPCVMEKIDVPARAYFAQLSLIDLMSARQPPRSFEELAQFPCSTRDWTLTVNERLSFHELKEAVPFEQRLENFELRSIFRSDKLGTDSKNVTLRFTYRDLSKTLSQEEVDTAHQKVVQEVTKKLGHQLVDSNLVV